MAYRDEYFDQEFEDEPHSDQFPMTEGQRTFHDRRFQEMDDEPTMEFCSECDKDTKHVSVKGHDGRDSYSYSECLTCGRSH